MNALAGVFLHVRPRDADDLRPPVDLDLEATVLAVRLVELAYLVALREVWIKVVLAGEAAVRPDRAGQGERRANGETNRLAVQDGEGAGKPQAHGAYVGIRRRAIRGRTPAEGLRLRQKLRVDLESDDGLITHLVRPI